MSHPQVRGVETRPEAPPDHLMGRTAGVRGLKLRKHGKVEPGKQSPRRVRGLKLSYLVPVLKQTKSHPQGAWVRPRE